MATIKDLQDLNLSKVASEALSEQIGKLISEYKEVSDKDFFIKTNQKFMDKFLSLTKKNYPEAVKNKEQQAENKPAEKPSDDPLRSLTENTLAKLTDLEIDMEGHDETIIATTRMELEEALKNTALKSKLKKAVQHYLDFEADISDTKLKKQISKVISELAKAVGLKAERDKATQEKAAKEKSKKILEQLEGLAPELAKCRAVIREHNKKKREAEGPKPKKNRYTRLKEKLLALVSLIPDKLKDDPKVQDKTEEVLLMAHTDLVEAWGMSKVKAKSGAKAIKDKFEEMEEKTQKEKSDEKN